MTSEQLQVIRDSIAFSVCALVVLITVFSICILNTLADILKAIQDKKEDDND